MGVDLKCYLPDDVRVEDVANVMGILAGCEKECRPFPSGSGYYMRVPDAKVRVVDSCPHMVHIFLNGKLVDGEAAHMATYFFECRRGGRLLLVRSTPFWCSIADALIDFFGGRVDYNDCDDVDIDREVPHPPHANNPEDGAEWYAFQERMACLSPLTDLSHERAAYQPTGRAEQ